MSDTDWWIESRQPASLQILATDIVSRCRLISTHIWSSSLKGQMQTCTNRPRVELPRESRGWRFFLRMLQCLPIFMNLYQSLPPPVAFVMQYHFLLMFFKQLRYDLCTLLLLQNCRLPRRCPLAGLHPSPHHHLHQQRMLRSTGKFPASSGDYVTGCGLYRPANQVLMWSIYHQVWLFRCKLCSLVPEVHGSYATHSDLMPLSPGFTG